MNEAVVLESSGNPQFELDIKRFYMPGTVIRTRCPSCGVDYVKDFDEKYLSYPSVGTPIEIDGYCSECNHEWLVCKVQLKLSVEIVPDTTGSSEST